MIKHMQIKNVFSLYNVKLDFVPGVNAIIGPSGTGKSSILRALDIALFNTLLGDYMISWGRKKSGYSISVAFDDGNRITRKKGKTGNQYIIKKGKSKELFDAVGKDVPEEVKEIVNMERWINFQNQLDGPFLLSERPSEVAKRINQTTDLTDIDTAISNGKRLSKEHKNQRDRYQEDTKVLKEQLESFKWLDGVDGELSALETEESRINRMKAKEKEMKYLLSNIKRSKDEIKRINPFIKLGSQIDKLLQKYNNIEDSKEELAGMQSHLNAIHKLKRSIRKNKVPDSFKKTIEELTEYAQSIRENKSDLEDREELLTRIRNTKKNIETLGKAADRLKKQFKASMPNICPLCGSDLKDGEHAH